MLAEFSSGENQKGEREDKNLRCFSVFFFSSSLLFFPFGRGDEKRMRDISMSSSYRQKFEMVNSYQTIPSF